jgi:cell wall-associated NlpC family hydrolase
MFLNNKGGTMNLIRNILGVILFIQLLIFFYIKPIHKDVTHHQSKQIIATTVKQLPISSEYTEWDDEKVAILNKKIEAFNQQLVKKQPETRQSTISPTKQVTSPQKSIKIAKQTKRTLPSSKKISKKTEHTPRISVREKIAKYAKTKLGKKYVWGAVGPRSFDCSGFTRAVYKSTTGIKIPRVSRDQAKVGKYVKFRGLKCGDMVFFDTEKKFSGRVNHVGIYLSNGNFIHASSARKKVIITNFNKRPFYKKRFLWGRRVVNKQS